MGATGMATYKVWLDGRKLETATLIEAQSSFSARQRLATQYGVKTFQIVAVKQTAPVGEKRPDRRPS
jgi:hypothetical protein